MSKLETEIGLQAPWQDLDATSIATAVVQGRDSLSSLALDAIGRLSIASDISQLKPGLLVAAFGNAARLCFHNGRVHRARLLLDLALKMCDVGWRRTHLHEWCRAMLGPHSFLAKLKALSGDCEGAVGAYREIHEFMSTGAAVQISDTLLTPDIYQWMLQFDQEFVQARNRAAAVYIVETAKALLIQKEYRGLLAFADAISLEPQVSAASQRHRLVIAEIRGKALAGLGEDGLALTEFETIGNISSAKNPAFCSVFAQAAHIAARSFTLAQGFEWLDRAEGLLMSCSQQVEMAASIYHGYFTCAYVRYLLSDYEGSFRMGQEALAAAITAQHSVGVMRARVLLNMVANSCEATECIAGMNCLAACKEEIARNLYGLERGAALVHLALAQRMRLSHAELSLEARQTVSALHHEGTTIPSSLQPYMNPRDRSDQQFLQEEKLEEMYNSFVQYAQKRVLT